MERLWTCVFCKSFIEGYIYQCPVGHSYCAAHRVETGQHCIQCKAIMDPPECRNLIVEQLRENAITVEQAMSECSVCFNENPDLLFQCTNGHRFCSNCRNSIFETTAALAPEIDNVVYPRCPECRYDITKPIRNIPLEDFHRPEKPCKNLKRGCTLIVHVDDREAHELICEFQYPIHYCQIANCDWKGRVMEQLPHYVNSHNFRLGSDKVTDHGDYILSIKGLWFGFIWQKVAGVNNNSMLFAISGSEIITKMIVTCDTEPNNPSNVEFCNIHISDQLPINKLTCPILSIVFQ